MHALSRVHWGVIWKPAVGKIKKMQPMRLCILLCKRFEETFENTQWRKVKQMQPVSLCILWCRQFEETFENPQWRKVKQMQPMQLCILWGKRLEETFENTQWGKAKQMQPVWFCKMFSPDNICIKYSYISSSQQYLCDYSTRFIFDKICWQQILLKSNQREM